MLAECLLHQLEQVGVVLHDEHGGHVGFDHDAFLLDTRCRGAVVSETTHGLVVHRLADDRGVDFLLRVCFLVDGDGHREGSPHPPAAFASYRAVVERDELVDQSQADARSSRVLPSVVAVEESGVEMVELFLVHADAIILHADDGFLLFDVKREKDMSVVAVVFDGVGEQVVENLVELVAVKPCRLLLFGQ